MRRRWIFPAVVAAVLLLASGALAQTRKPVMMVGAGFASIPDYEGSDDYEPIPVGLFSAHWPSGRNVELIGPRLRANLLPDRNWRLGPVLQYRLGRDSDVESAAVSRLGSIDDSVELGAYAGFELNRWRATLQIVHDISDGHDDMLISTGLSYSIPVTRRFDMALQVDTTWAGDNYMDGYFSVSASEAEASGLSEHSAGSGFKDVGLGVSLRLAADENWGLMGIVNYKRLIGDAGDSPVVDDAGSANQLISGLAVTFTF